MVATLKKPKAKKALPDLTQTSSIMQGHNGPSTDVVLVFAGRKIELQAEKKALGMKIKKLNQQITNAGITNKLMDRGLLIAETGVDAVVAEYRELIFICKALGAPIGTQLSLISNPEVSGIVSHEDLLNKAFAAGRILGLLGKNVDDQAYNPNTDLGQEHMKGWNDGQKVLMDQMVRNSEEAAAQAKSDAEAKAEKELERAAKADAAKEPRGRKGKAVAAAQEAMAKLDDENGEETTAVH
jgi:hypothetical protein